MEDGTANHKRKVEIRKADGRIVLKDRMKIVLLEIDDGGNQPNGS